MAQTNSFPIWELEELLEEMQKGDEAAATVESLHWRWGGRDRDLDPAVGWRAVPPDGRTLTVRQLHYLLGLTFTQEAQPVRGAFGPDGKVGLEFALVAGGRRIVLSSDQGIRRIFESSWKAASSVLPGSSRQPIRPRPSQKLLLAMRAQLERLEVEHMAPEH